MFEKCRHFSCIPFFILVCRGIFRSTSRKSEWHVSDHVQKDAIILSTRVDGRCYWCFSALVQTSSCFKMFLFAVSWESNLFCQSIVYLCNLLFMLLLLVCVTCVNYNFVNFFLDIFLNNVDCWNCVCLQSYVNAVYNFHWVGRARGSWRRTDGYNYRYLIGWTFFVSVLSLWFSPFL